jgi:hypothetical protein
MEVTFEPACVIVGNNVWVNGTVRDKKGMPVTGTVEISLRHGIESAQKYINLTYHFENGVFHVQMSIPYQLKSGLYYIVTDYLPTLQYPTATEFSLLTVKGTTTIGFKHENIRIEVARGTVTSVIMYLKDNTGEGLANKKVRISYHTVTSHELERTTTINGSFKFEFIAEASASLGYVDVITEFEGEEPWLLGCAPTHKFVIKTVTYIDIISPSSDDKVVRGESLEVRGKLYDDTDTGISDKELTILVGLDILGTADTDAHGAFTFSCTVPRTVHRGPTNIEVRFDGELGYDSSNMKLQVIIYAKPVLMISIPEAPQNLVAGETYEVIVYLGEADAPIGISSAKLTTELGGKPGPGLITNETGYATFIVTFPRGKTELAIKVKYEGSDADYYVGIEREAKFKLTRKFIGMDWSFYLPLIIGIGAIILVGAVWLIWSRHHIKVIKRIVAETATELETSDEYRRIIYRAYKRMCECLLRYGFMRHYSETPREFARAVRRALPFISNTHLDKLTKLFEEARYSDHKLTKRDKTRALRSLREVKRSLEIGSSPSTSRRL